MSDQTNAIDRLWRRVVHSLARGRINLVQDNAGVQMVQANLGSGDVRDKLPRMGEYGLASVPPAGSDAVIAFLAGERANGVVVATNHQASRKKNMSSGESALHDNRGSFVYLAADGLHIHTTGRPVFIETDDTLELNITGGQVLVNCPGGVVFNGPVTFNDPVSMDAGATVTGGLLNNAINVGSTHEHAVATGATGTGGHTGGPF